MSSVSTKTDAQVWERIERILETIPLPENQVIVRTWLQERQAIGLRASTLLIHANCLRGFCVHLGAKKLQDAVRMDVIGYVNNAKSMRRYRSVKVDGSSVETEKPIHLCMRTLAQRKEVLKPFFRWLRGTDDKDPPETKGLKVKRAEDHIPTDALITRDDLAALLQAHVDVQDKARIAVLYESGFRAGEFCALNVGSVAFEELEGGVWSVVLTLPKGVRGLKTGARRIRVFDCVDYLKAWIDQHPHRNDPNAALWFTMSRRAPGARLSANALLVWCYRAGKKAELKKDCNPHIWRHAAATERAKLGWNEAQMRAFFGWTRNSDMPSVYTHLAGLDCDEMEMERRGLTPSGKHKGPALTPLTCAYCAHRNPHTALFCQKCRRPVTPEAEKAIEEKKQAAAIDAAMKILRGLDPEAIAKLADTYRQPGTA